MAIAERDLRIAYVSLSLMSLVFGGAWVAGKVAVETMPPLALATARFLIASALLFAWAAWRGWLPARPTPRDLPLIVVLGSTAVAGYNVLFFLGLSLAPASDGAIIVPGLAPILTAALAWPLLGERLSVARTAGLGVALAGLVLVAGPGGAQDGRRLLGDGLFLLGALCWAVYSLVGPAATRRWGAVGATLYATLAGTALLVLPARLEQGWERMLTAPAEAWVSLLFLAAVTTVLGFVLFYEGVQRIGPGRAAAFAFLVPIVGVASSVALLGEALAPATVAGGVLVLLGLWFVQRSGAAPAPASPSPIAVERS